ncbi:MAG: hypothetical protein JWP20_2214 [Roseomonas sp.]|nr:hypothetical protein [Roseomonas sp.]
MLKQADPCLCYRPEHRNHSSMEMKNPLRDTTPDTFFGAGSSRGFFSGERRNVFPWCRPLVFCTLALLIAQEAISLHLGTVAPHNYISPTFFAPTALGAFALTMILVPPSAWTRILLLGLLIEAVRFCLQVAFGRSLLNLVLLPGFGLGVAAWCFLTHQVLVRHGQARQDALNMLAAALVMPLGHFLLWPCILGTIPFLPVLYDGVAVRLEATLGIQPASVIGLLFRDFPPLHIFHLVVYIQIPLAMSIVAALEAKSGQRMGVGMIPTCLAAATIGYFLYAVMPVVGPLPIFGEGFAEAMRHLVALPSEPIINTTNPRNAMPSLHMTWALLIYLACRQHGRVIRVGGACFALGTALATLGLGEHYFIDLVVAVPLVLFVRAICAVDVPLARFERWGALALGVALLFGWSLMVRGIVNPVVWPGLTPLLMGGTVLACFSAERVLFRSERGAQATELWQLRAAAGRPG